MSCSHCGSEKIAARGLCSGCYSRQRRTGSLARTNVRNTGICAIDGCNEIAHAKGLCSLHYARQQHPLRNTWKLIRSRYPNETPKAWGRFEGFLRDSGERPSPRHQLRRVDDAKPYGPNNIKWVEPVTNERGDWFSPEDRALYSRQWTLNRKYQIGHADYASLLNKQNGVCAVCRGAETFVNPKTGRLQELSVDHNHATGAVRGLLCVRCNRMLGYARDDTSILANAIVYLGGA